MICPPSRAHPVISRRALPIRPVCQFDRRHRAMPAQCARDRRAQAKARCNFNYATRKPEAAIHGHCFDLPVKETVKRKTGNILNDRGASCRTTRPPVIRSLTFSFGGAALPRSPRVVRWLSLAGVCVRSTGARISALPTSLRRLSEIGRQFIECTFVAVVAFVAVTFVGVAVVIYRRRYGARRRWTVLPGL
ncbi:hypothetical protein ACVIF9_003133 [Bradyrhizobium sp. USDA 4350]